MVGFTELIMTTSSLIEQIKRKEHTEMRTQMIALI